MLLFLIAVAAFFLFARPITLSLLSAFLGTKHNKEEDKRSRDELAEVNGGIYQRMSVFEHVERGLRRNPNGAAVTCLFQPGHELLDLLGVSGVNEGGALNAVNSVHSDRLNNQLGRDNEKVNGYDGHDTSSGAATLSRTATLLPHQSAAHMVDQSIVVRTVNSIDGCNGHHVDKKPVLWSKAHSEVNGHSVTQTPQTTFSSVSTFTLTYRQLHESGLRLAAGLLANGATTDTTMLMLIPNGAEYAILLWACLLLRITYVSVDPSSLDISGFTELKHTLQSVKPQLIVVPNAAGGRVADVAMTELGLPQPIRFCLFGTSTTRSWKPLASVVSDGTRLSVDTNNLISGAKDDRPSRIHTIFFTSGTSGTPKGCPLTVAGMSHDLHSQAWLIDSESGTARLALQQAHNSRAICPLQMLQTWRAGGCVLMTRRGLRVDDVAEAICGSHPYHATFIVLSPPMVHELATELATRQEKGIRAEHDVSSVRRIQLGGDAITKDILVKCQTLFPRAQVCVNHGMSEGPGLFVWPFLETPVSEIPFFGEICPVGTAAPGTLVRVWDSDAKRTANRDQLGELHVSRGSLISSYWASRSAESFYDDSEGRWFNTGDMAIVSKTGLIYILGRKKDTIKRAGVGIMPAAIESSVEAFTATQTIVVPLSHSVAGAEPFAVLSSYNGKTEEQIKEHVLAALGRDYALGGLASLQDLGLSEFPVNQTHKVMKGKVQAVVEECYRRREKSIK